MEGYVTLGVNILAASWQMLLEASIYIVFGLLVSGLLKIFLSPAYVASHLGEGRFKPVFKAALLGIPIPLCSCGVLPAAASLKKQGANNGATMAFLISTPESGVDSITISWALLDPIMTVFRPLSAFISAVVAGVAENVFNPSLTRKKSASELECHDSGCCTSGTCSSEIRQTSSGVWKKMLQGVRYSFTDLWGDLVFTFFIGVFLAGVVTALIPDSFFQMYLGGGIGSMLLMLAVGIPLYICATASTPLAAAFILKGVSPGAALVFLLIGPATNIASLSMLISLLGKRATALYLFSISVVSLLCGVLLNKVYAVLDLSPQAVMGQATEYMPEWLKLAAALFVLGLSVMLLIQRWLDRLRRKKEPCLSNCKAHNH